MRLRESRLVNPGLVGADATQRIEIGKDSAPSTSGRWSGNGWLFLFGEECRKEHRKIEWHAQISDSMFKRREDVRSYCRGAMRPSFASIAALSNQRAQGKPDARCTRGLVCNGSGSKRTRAYRSSGGNRFPCAAVYGLYVVSSASLALLPPSPARERELDTSMRVSEPHDFAVRFRRPRQEHRPRPPHPRPAPVRCATPLLVGRDGC